MLMLKALKSSMGHTWYIFIYLKGFKVVCSMSPDNDDDIVGLGSKVSRDATSIESLAVTKICLTITVSLWAREIKWNKRHLNTCFNGAAVAKVTTKMLRCTILSLKHAEVFLAFLCQYLLWQFGVEWVAISMVTCECHAILVCFKILWGSGERLSIIPDMQCWGGAVNNLPTTRTILRVQLYKIL